MPKSALALNDGRTGVFLIKEDRVVFQPVVVGRQSEATAEIKEGLLGGEALVANAAGQALSSGMKVKVGR